MVIPLANHTLIPHEKVEFTLRVGEPTVSKIESIHQGLLLFEQTEPEVIKFSLPLDASDYVKVYFGK